MDLTALKQTLAHRLEQGEVLADPAARWPEAWEAWVAWAQEPVTGALIIDERVLEASDEDLLVHQSWGSEEHYVVSVRRQVTLRESGGAEAGRAWVELRFVREGLRRGRVPRATRWGAAGPGPGPETHPAISRWAGGVATWAEQARGSNSFKALEEAGVTRVEICEAVDHWPVPELPEQVEPTKACADQLARALESVGFDRERPSLPLLWHVLRAWLAVPVRQTPELNDVMLLFEADISTEDHSTAYYSSAPRYSVGITQQFVFTGEDGYGGLEALFLDLTFPLGPDVLALAAPDQDFTSLETFWDGPGLPLHAESTPAFQLALRLTPSRFSMDHGPVG